MKAENTFHEFDFCISQEYLNNAYDVKFLGHEYARVQYAITDNRVVVLTVKFGYIVSTYIKDMYALSDAIYHAAENNALSNDLLLQDSFFDKLKIFCH